MKTPYSATDKTIAYLNKQYGKLFRSVTAFDELNVIQASHDIYDKVYDMVKQEAARLSSTVYRKHHREEEPSVFDAVAWVALLVLAYNPVTKYVFDNEIERKRARFAESVIASDVPTEEIALAKRLLAGMNAQFLDDLTHETMIQAFKDNGTKRVRWVTSPDDKRCKRCASMHGKIYPIDNIPAKPHIHCRCWVEEVTK
jgi:SPP1 gp7 family putative phage head morphogenesis protein